MPDRMLNRRYVRKNIERYIENMLEDYFQLICEIESNRLYFRK